MYNGFSFKTSFVYEDKKTKNKPRKGKVVSFDLGINNLIAIYDPEGEQYILPGSNIISINNYYNKKINRAKSLKAKENKTFKSKNQMIMEEIDRQVRYIEDSSSKYIPIRQTKNSNKNKEIKNQSVFIQSNGKNNNTNKKEKSSKKIKRLLMARENKINEIFNQIVEWIVKKYKNCEKIIIGYNECWKKCVNMGRKMNQRFYQIPYAKLIKKLKDKLERNNQELRIIEESYTSKCDALALEEVCKHNKYKGKRTRRGLFASSTGKLINADINGAINIMRKWKKKQGIKMEKITGEKIFNPVKIYP